MVTIYRGIELKPIYLPEKPEQNWTFKGKKLKPIYLPNIQTHNEKILP